MAAKYSPWQKTSQIKISGVKNMTVEFNTNCVAATMCYLNRTISSLHCVWAVIIIIITFIIIIGLNYQYIQK
jgi:hypothetical protein